MRASVRNAIFLVALLATVSLSACKTSGGDVTPTPTPASSVSASGPVTVSGRIEVDASGHTLTCTFTLQPMPQDAIVNVKVTGNGVKQPPSLMSTQSWNSKGMTSSGAVEAGQIEITEGLGKTQGEYGCEIQEVTSGPHEVEISGQTSLTT